MFMKLFITSVFLYYKINQYFWLDYYFLFKDKLIDENSHTCVS